MEGGTGGGAERRKQSDCQESLHPQSDPSFPTTPISCSSTLPPPQRSGLPSRSPSDSSPSFHSAWNISILRPWALLAPAPGLSPSQTPCFSAFPSPHPCPLTPLTCSSVMDMISCQVNSISPSSRVGNCVTLFLLCWGGHGGILLGQGLVQGPESPNGPSSLCQRRNRS